jgi:hypothetical protein
MPSLKKSKATKPKVAVSKSGVDKAIDALVANRSKIGALVIHVMSLPGQQVALDVEDPSEKGQRGMMSADIMTHENEEERTSTRVGSVITQGMAVDISKRLMQRNSGGLFG